MAERRMFAKTIIDSDAFLDMPLSTQALYFHLSMRADDDGFINNPNKIQRMIGGSSDDLKLLLIKKFLIQFENGVVVIKHWKIHNYIQNDRYKETLYQEEKSKLFVKDNKSYTLKPTSQKLIKNKIVDIIENNSMDTVCIHDVSIEDTQVRLGKDRLDKLSLGEDKSTSMDADYINFFNSNFHLISVYEKETLDSYHQDGITNEAITLALRKAIEADVRNIKYVKKILDNWLAHNIKTVEDVKAADEEFKRKNTSSKQKKKEGNFNNFEQRSYDFESLERKLLGWDKDDENER